MTLENLYFRRDFYYNVRLVEKYINIIQTTDSPKRALAYKNFVFRMMKDVVKKNISNCLNLMRKIESLEQPTRDELIADCYIVFERCCEKYLVGHGYNFYFFFNKSLSRKFFRDYQKAMQRSMVNSETIEVSAVLDRQMKINETYGGASLLLENLRFTVLEKKICHSKMNGQKSSDFLKANPEITNAQYSRALKNIKAKLILAKEKQEI